MKTSSWTLVKETRVMIAAVERGDTARTAWIAIADHLIAIRQAEQTMTYKEIAAEVNKTPGWVSKVVRWRESGSQGMPFSGTAEAKGRGANEATRVLRSPEIRRAAISKLSQDEMVDLASDLMSQRGVRESLRDEEERKARQKIIEANERAAQGRPAPTISQWFWRIVSKLTDWERGLTQIQDELANLTPTEQAEVAKRYRRLRDRLDTGIRLLEGADEQGDVIDGVARDAGVRELTSA